MILCIQVLSVTFTMASSSNVGGLRDSGGDEDNGGGIGAERRPDQVSYDTMMEVMARTQALVHDLAASIPVQIAAALKPPATPEAEAPLGRNTTGNR